MRALAVLAAGLVLAGCGPAPIDATPAAPAPLTDAQWTADQQRKGWPYDIGAGYDTEHPKSPCVARAGAEPDTSDVKCRSGYIEKGI